ncbi:hypothetical protein K435DRAFT_844074 [Dendrothele bispora CBS 962.96]|uniref:Uncharacterized protein n=1 Tax=Dendrothele bispora (strain CBS 962.96) TaxID=1314807 RepID=A0A4S8L4M2_DENBC|nr:hypothetical protein K435DRAFT_844074 [Dendrothele bispora CBS 962.96]
MFEISGNNLVSYPAVVAYGPARTSPAEFENRTARMLVWVAFVQFDFRTPPDLSERVHMLPRLGTRLATIIDAKDTSCSQEEKFYWKVSGPINRFFRVTHTSEQVFSEHPMKKKDVYISSLGRYRNQFGKKVLSKGMAETATVSLIVACLALAGTVINSAFTAWQNLYLEKMKHRNTFETVVSKYRDPLHNAATDLSSKLVNLMDKGLANLNSYRDDYVVKHTCFVIGQFLSWVYILRIELQFLHPLSDMGRIYMTLNKIRKVLLTDSYSDSYTDTSFMIWSGEQQAIGEIMTVEGKDGRMKCMGFSTFVREWDKDDGASELQLQKWFNTIVAAIRGWNRASHNHQRRL